MTLNEAVTRFDQLIPNILSYEQKTEFISRLDKRVFDDIMSAYEGCPCEEFSGYTADTPYDTQLLLPFPYDDIYGYLVAVKADMINGDTARYNNSANLFNTRFEEFCNYYNRTHKIKKNVRMGDIV